MERYGNYKVEDFVQDDSFRLWVLSPGSDTERYWTDFLAQYPDKHTDVSQAKALLLAMDQSGILPTELQGIRMWEKIDAATAEEERRVTPLWQHVLARHWMSAAAVVLIGLTLWWLLVLRDGRQMPGSYEKQVARIKEQLIEHANRKGESQRIVLPDGSIAMLGADSKLSYKKDFAGDQRGLYLAGEGYFEVVKNEAKPFVVFTGQVVTQVVGTRFTVSSPKGGEQVSVSVRSGKVKVFTMEQYADSNSGKPVFLTANQTAVYRAEGGFVTRPTMRSPDIIKAPEKFPDFNFRSTAIATVFSTLEESYGVSIEYDENVIANCDLTAQLGDEPLFKKLDIICHTIDATYEVWGNKIVVTGKGCTTH